MIRHFARLIVFIAAASFLTGCVSTPPSLPSTSETAETTARQFKQHPDAVNLYVARPVMFGSYDTYRIHVNGDEIGHLNAGEFMNVRATSGQHTFDVTPYTSDERYSYTPRDLDWKFSIEFEPGAVAIFSCGEHGFYDWKSEDRRLLPDAACESGGSYRRYENGGIRSCSIQPKVGCLERSYR